MERGILDVVRECDKCGLSKNPTAHLMQALLTSIDSFTDGEPTSHLGDPGKYYAFKVNGCGSVLGYITRDIVEKIQWSHIWSVNHQKQSVTLATPATATADMRSRALEDTLKATQTLDIISVLHAWRNETFPVYDTGGQLLLEIERCASALFGIVTYGVQLLCYVRSEQGPQLWIGRRSESKQTYPGMLDSTAAGGLGTGRAPIEALISEAQEEASIPEEIIRKKVKPLTPLTYFHVRGSKAGGETGLLQPEVEYTYELELGPDMIPHPRDSEVECFSLYTVGEVLEALNQRLFKPNSAIVVVEFLIQHGILTEENESEYFEILSHLYRKLEFPILIQPSI